MIFSSANNKIKIKLVSSALPVLFNTASALLISSVYKRFFGKESLLRYVFELLIFGVFYALFTLLNYFQYVNKEKTRQNIQKMVV